DVGADEPGLPGEILERYRVALGIEPLSVTAATGLARLANRLKDVACAVQAAVSLADLAVPLLEQALVADADSLGAAARLAKVRAGLGQGERLVDTFRSALFRART